MVSVKLVYQCVLISLHYIKRHVEKTRGIARMCTCGGIDLTPRCHAIAIGLD